MARELKIRKQIKNSYPKKKRDSILKANKDKNWVQRVLNPSLNDGKNIPSPYEKGKTSSHLLSAEIDGQGKSWVYPEVVDTGKEKFEHLGKEKGLDYAIKNKTGIQFSTIEEANEFSQNYKTEAFKNHKEMKVKKKVYRKRGNTNLVDKGKVPKGIFGALIAAAVSGGIAIWQNQEAKAEQGEARKRAFVQTEGNKAIQDRQVVQNHESEGVTINTPYNKMGGNINPSYNVSGGSLEPLASDSKLVDGNTHREGGVKLSNGATPVAEVQKDEVLQETAGKTQVLSDDLYPKGSKKSYAELGEVVGRKKGKLEKELSKGATRIKVNTNKRMINNLDKDQERLFADQEAQKEEKGIKEQTTEFAFGGEFAPYLDNVVNLIDTLSKPKVPDPVHVPLPSMKTEVNRNAQLSNVRNEVKAGQEFIDKNTASSRGARGERAKLGLRGAQAENAILSEKENTETQLENRASQVQAQYANINTGISNQHRGTVLARGLATSQEITGNAANLVSDMGAQDAIERKEVLADKKIGLYREIYQGGNKSLQARTILDIGQATGLPNKEFMVEYNKILSSEGMDKSVLREYEDERIRRGL